MTKMIGAAVLGCMLATSATAKDIESLTEYLHKAASPQPVPGGTSVFILDETAPTGSSVASDQVSVVKKTSGSFPTFSAAPFTQDAVLPIKIGTTVHLSANLSLSGCARVDVDVLQIDPLGGQTVAATLTATDATIPQGSVNGTVGFATFRLTSPGISCTLLDGIPILEGGSVGLRVTVTNECDANRTVWLAYDGAAAPGEVDFVEPTKEEDLALRLACQQKCGTEKLKAATKKASDRTKCFEKAVAKSLPVDQSCLDKASDKMASAFAKTEAKGGCVFTGDSAAVEGAIDSAVGAFVSALDPGQGSSAAVKCATTKIKAAGTKAEAKLNCHSSAFARGQGIPLGCLPKAEDKFSTAFQKAEAKGGCATTGDAGTIEGIVDGLVDSVVSKLIPKNPT